MSSASRGSSATPSLHPKAAETLCIVYRAAVEEGLEPLELILYGSWARGDWLYTSDLDVIIVSWRCTGPLHRRLDGVYRRLARYKPPLYPEMLCYTPRELEELAAAPTMLRDASRYWLRLPRATLEKMCRGASSQPP